MLCGPAPCLVRGTQGRTWDGGLRYSSAHRSCYCTHVVGALGRRCWEEPSSLLRSFGLVRRQGHRTDWLLPTARLLLPPGLRPPESVQALTAPFQLLTLAKAWGPATHLVFVALVHTQGLGAEAVPHTEVAHQVGQVNGPDAPGQPQLLQGAFKLPVVQLAQVPVGKRATEGCSPSKGSWFGSHSTRGPISYWQSPLSTEGSGLCHETLCPAHVPPGHRLKLPGLHAVVPRVKGLDSASPISCGLCDFG